MARLGLGQGVPVVCARVRYYNQGLRVRVRLTLTKALAEQQELHFMEVKNTLVTSTVVILKHLLCNLT